jgi:hypothetical protein
MMAMVKHNRWRKSADARRSHQLSGILKVVYRRFTRTYVVPDAVGHSLLIRFIAFRGVDMITASESSSGDSCEEEREGR